MDLVDLWFVICDCIEGTLPSNRTIDDNDVYPHNQLSLYGTVEIQWETNNICTFFMKALSLKVKIGKNL